MKTLERITSSEVRHWKTISASLSPGKGFLVENHGEPEAVIVHPDDAVSARFDLESHFAAVRKSRTLKPANIHRAPEL